MDRQVVRRLDNCGYDGSLYPPCILGSETLAGIMTIPTRPMEGQNMRDRLEELLEKIKECTLSEFDIRTCLFLIHEELKYLRESITPAPSQPDSPHERGSHSADNCDDVNCLEHKIESDSPEGEKE